MARSCRIASNIGNLESPVADNRGEVCQRFLFPNHRRAARWAAGTEEQGVIRVGKVRGQVEDVAGDIRQFQVADRRRCVSWVSRAEGYVIDAVVGDDIGFMSTTDRIS